MLDLFHSIFRHHDLPVNDARHQLIREASHRAIEVIDKRLNAVSGSHRRIRSAVEVAIDHVVGMAEAFPEPERITFESYRRNPVIGALFASQDHLLELLTQDQAINTARHQLTHRGDLYSLLVTTMKKRHYIGPDLVNGVIQQEVALTAVSFDHHHFLDVSGDEVMTRTRLKKRAFDVMLHQILEVIEARQHSQQTLQGQRRLIQHKLDLLHKAGWHFSPPTTSEGGVSELEASLHRIEEALAAFGAPEQTLENHLNLLKQSLENPEQLLALKPISPILDMQNIERSSESAHAHVVPLHQLLDRHQRAFIITPLRIDMAFMNQAQNSLHSLAPAL
ncbi:MAG: hypothetical protein IPM37_14555 [Hahellaceae bacterium]|nr:hypothetical protein [Hahellaceae bacterium]